MPADYVHKFVRMFQDIKISAELNQQFKEEYRKKKGSIAGNISYSKELKTYLVNTPTILPYPDSINIKILNAGAWARGSDRVTVSLPLELEDYILKVEDFYNNKHSDRKLYWLHHMSNGTVSLS